MANVGNRTTNCGSVAAATGFSAKNGTRPHRFSRITVIVTRRGSRREDYSSFRNIFPIGEQKTSLEMAFFFIAINNLSVE